MARPSRTRTRDRNKPNKYKVGPAPSGEGFEDTPENRQRIKDLGFGSLLDDAGGDDAGGGKKRFFKPRERGGNRPGSKGTRGYRPKKKDYTKDLPRPTKKSAPAKPVKSMASEIKKVTPDIISEDPFTIPDDKITRDYVERNETPPTPYIDTPGPDRITEEYLMGRVPPTPGVDAPLPLTPLPWTGEIDPSYMTPPNVETTTPVKPSLTPLPWTGEPDPSYMAPPIEENIASEKPRLSIEELEGEEGDNMENWRRYIEKNGRIFSGPNQNVFPASAKESSISLGALKNYFGDTAIKSFLQATS